MNHQSQETRESVVTRSRRDKFYGIVAGAAIFFLGSIALGHAGGTRLQTSDYSVDVKNLETSPVQVHSVDTPAHDPFTTFIEPSASAFAQFKVPADKRLIVTLIDARISGGATIEDIYLQGTSGGKNDAIFIPVNQSEGDFRYVLQQLQTEFDPGTTVYVAVDDSDATDTTAALTTLQGYYVDEAGTVMNNGY